MVGMELLLVMGRQSREGTDRRNTCFDFSVGVKGDFGISELELVLRPIGFKSNWKESLKMYDLGIDASPKGERSSGASRCPAACHPPGLRCRR